MRIEADLDPLHSERLRALQGRLNKPLDEVLGVAIDAAIHHLESMPQADRSSLYEALDAIGFIGCIDDDEQLSVDYKSRIDFSNKSGQKG
ncbi:MAG: hypothetical protein C1943_18010 [Halochromatium sp.]|nr:hypothetical protein [Halochromatium sp.]